MKKVLGLDLGVGSIGWSLIEVDDNYYPQNILGMDSRIVPLSTEETNEFNSGLAATKNQKRTTRRTARKGYDRYQMRRRRLTDKLNQLGMLPGEDLMKLPALELWALRAKAATPGEKLTLPELGRVLYHINQKRGYRHSSSDDTSEKKQTDYVAEVNERYAKIRGKETIGQYFSKALKASEISTAKGSFLTYRAKEQVFPRAAYIDEFDTIIECQKAFYPEILSESTVHELRDEIIFYQRDLKSCKHLVSLCEFSKHTYYDKKNDRFVDSGPKVAPKSSPIFQVCKIWEKINNLRFTNSKNEKKELSREQKEKLFDFLDTHERIKVAEFNKRLGIKKNDEWIIESDLINSLSGNITKTKIIEALSGLDNIEGLTKFNLKEKVDPETGEILKEISADFEQTHKEPKENDNAPFYRLWHVVYSIDCYDDMKRALERQFSITSDTVTERLYKCHSDFIKQGYGTKSVKMMRQILPYLMQGEMYSVACEHAGINHSNSLTAEANELRPLSKEIQHLKKNELRQPTVEKILNQMITVVNALINKYGHIDEIHVELARILKLSLNDRKKEHDHIKNQEKKNKEYSDRIREYGLVPSKNKILKYRLWEESGHSCFYCGKKVSGKEFLQGLDVEIEHVVPKSLLFDDSFSNKVCACRDCNSTKNNQTAYDFMKSRGEKAFEDYLERVAKAYAEHTISKTKRERLLTSKTNIPKDFINRQLTQTQYISRKAMELLQQVCRDVYGSSGRVTAYLRKIWGYDKILENINLPRYREGGLTEIVEYEHKGQIHSEERIKNWSKRLDHRHHAIDALTIACTRHNIIQKLNTLNAQNEIGETSEQIKLDKWTENQPHFSVSEVTNNVAKILISFKPGKKISSPGKRYTYKGHKPTLVQDNLLIPRGELHKEYVYGIIKSIDPNKIPTKKLFERIDDIVKPAIKQKVKARLTECGGDVQKAANSLKDSPLYLDNENTIPLEYASCYKSEYVLKYKLSDLKLGDVEYIVDGRIRTLVEERLKQFNGKPKEAFAEPLYADKDRHIPIKTVRCRTNLKQVVPIRKNEKGDAIGFVNPSNNHHIAIYRDAQGNLQQHIVTFWNAVDRKKYNIPVVIKRPDEIWQNIIDKNLPEDFLAKLPNHDWKYVLSLQQNEMFILGMRDDEFNDALNAKDYKTLGEHLYRVQKLSNKIYFRHQYETQLDDSKNALNMKAFYRISSLPALFGLYPRKVFISAIGKISESL